MSLSAASHDVHSPPCIWSRVTLGARSSLSSFKYPHVMKNQHIQKVGVVSILAAGFSVVSVFGQAICTSGHGDVGAGYIPVDKEFEPHWHLGSGAVVDGSLLGSDAEYDPADLRARTLATMHLHVFMKINCNFFGEHFCRIKIPFGDHPLRCDRSQDDFERKEADRGGVGAGLTGQ
jgi:hypothetical protein